MKKLLFVLMLSSYSAVFCEKDPVVIGIAQQMRDLAPQCQRLSSEEMKAVRRKFLENNKNATIEDLVNAINTVVDEKDIISYFRSFDGSVCEEHAQFLLNDKRRGEGGIYVGKGKTTIDTLLSWRMLS